MNYTEYDKLLVATRYWLQGTAQQDSSYFQVLKALSFALEFHTGFRKDGETPEFYHQLNMVSYARSLVGLVDEPALLLTVIILHDTYEDYPDSHIRLKLEFPLVYDMLVRISKVRNGDKISYDQYFSELSTCIITTIAKAIDRIHNLSTMSGVFTVEKKLEYLSEVDVWFLPMLKKARRKFPEHEPILELLKSTLNILKEAISYYVAQENHLRNNSTTN